MFGDPGRAVGAVGVEAADVEDDWDGGGEGCGGGDADTGEDFGVHFLSAIPWMCGMICS